MSDKENDEVFDATPPGRRRKRTIMSEGPPDINAIITEPEDTKTEIGVNEEETGDNEYNNEYTTIDDETIADKTILDNKDDITANSDSGVSNSSPEIKDRVVFTLDTAEKESNDTKEVENKMNKEPEVVNEPKAPEPPNDIIYDDTKPRRLHPKNLKLDVNVRANNNGNAHALRQSISYLISPDERNSPPRRRSHQPMSTPNFQQVIYSDLISPDHKDVANVKRAHYDRSPETRRRKCSSPVQRLIVKNGQAAVAEAARGRERKCSSEARLGNTGQALSPEVKRSRQRKISSDARLEHRPDEQYQLPVEQPRKRKVSFDTTALYNGNKVMPLNDGPKLSFQGEPQYFIEESVHEEESPVFAENGARPKVLTPPRIVCTCVDDDGCEHIDTECSMTEKSNSETSDDLEEGYASGYDNKAYTADDEDSLPGNKLQQTSNMNMESDSGPVRRVSPARGSAIPLSSDSPAIIPHSTSQQSLQKKLSSSSLPSSFGRRVPSFDEMPTKSILKVRQTDGESLASEESFRAKSFKVRKDSIALFMDNSGELAMQQLRKDNMRRWQCFGKSDVKRLWADRKNLMEKYKLHLLVLSLFLMTFAFVVVGLHFHSEHHKNAATSQKIFLDGKTRVLSLTDVDAMDTFTGKLGLGIPYWKHPKHCYSNFAQIYDKTCLKWKEHGRIEVAYFQSNNTNCYNVTWDMQPGTPQYDCFSIGDGYWYGPINTTLTQWPLSRDRFRFQVNKARHYDSGTFSTAVEYYWISSTGQAIIVDSNYPLEVNWNWDRPNSFCIKGKKDGDFYYETATTLNQLHYTVCNGRNIVETHRFIRSRFYPAVTQLPDKSFIEFPHWSSVWDSEDFVLNQTEVGHVADEISERNLNCSSIEIDGKWETKFGDLTFNNKAFDNMTDLVSRVEKTGCGLALNIYPFFNFQSDYFKEGLTKHYFVRDNGEAVPALLRWQYGVGAMLDVSNPDARDWYTSKIRKLASDLDIDTFRLAYGTLAWVPHKPVFDKADTTPNQVKQMFSSMVSTLGNVIIQSTSQSQHTSTLLGISSHVQISENRKCIRNIIPDVLNLGLMGYPFVMSDGFSLDLKHKGDEALPNRDLFIRWMQLSTFMPAMRYTIKPWSYDHEVVEAARNMTDLHSKQIIDAIFKVKNRILDGDPIIKPLWWDNSGDHVTFTINDQFIMADRYLVAPVLCEIDDTQLHLATRDIYIPGGLWKDVNRENFILGPRRLERYKVAQFEIPYFEKMEQYGDR